AAGGVPGAPRAVAAAEVHGQDAALAVDPGNASVVDLDVLGQRLVRIDAHLAVARSAFVGDVVRIVRVVDLNVGRALRGDGLDFRSDDLGGVQAQFAPAAIDLVGHAGRPAAGDDVRGRRHGDLPGVGRVLPQEGRFGLRQPRPLVQPLAHHPAAL